MGSDSDKKRILRIHLEQRMLQIVSSAKV